MSKKLRIKHLIEAEILITLTEIFKSVKKQDGKFNELLVKLDKLNSRYKN